MLLKIKNVLLRVKLLSFTLFIGVILAGCSGKDGDPGPQGTQGVAGTDGNGNITKIGYLKGTVSGTRQDGTAFSESFDYEYANDSIQSFTTTGGVQYISINRYSNSLGSRSLSLNLMEEETDVLVPSGTSYYPIYFTFLKEINSNTLFTMNVIPYFQATTAFVREISTSKNVTYNFGVNSSTGGIYHYSTTYNDQSAYYFYISNTSYQIYYSQSTGKLLGIYDYMTSTSFTSGDLFDKYNALKFVYNENLDQYVFVDASTEAGLYEEIPAIAADQFTITNYNLDSSTGVLSFSYTLKVSGYITGRRVNTTGHDLTITGTFNSGAKVYENSVARIGG